MPMRHFPLKKKPSGRVNDNLDLNSLGEGELNEANGNIYKGSFYQHKKHGRGYQLYRLVLKLAEN